jgi:hypothetical protein
MNLYNSHPRNYLLTATQLREEGNDFEWVKPIIKLYQGDARNLDKIGNEEIDSIATHPPYASIPFKNNKY